MDVDPPHFQKVQNLLTCIDQSPFSDCKNPKPLPIYEICTNINLNAQTHKKKHIAKEDMPLPWSG
jgi:hypothetical protein